MLKKTTKNPAARTARSRRKAMTSDQMKQVRGGVLFDKDRAALSTW